ncbi:Polysaccharide biosynthesis/export protein [Wenzhouxiangella marina]|uniref:Polysaccharide biosynthesis/export protein n=1 Tax=Wenzhouxiangella marina TaxID=1579979 RepID=A0A0K0XYJ4_9GAMM|nr:Polysaccharide biosynthesis/export protein [Wenzhouxiangella marina]
MATRHPDWFVVRLITALALLALLSACASGGANRDMADFQEEFASQARVDSINEQLLSFAATADLEAQDYRIGAGDQIQIDIFNVPELSGDYRVAGMGTVNMPLIGQIELSGYSLQEAEQIIADAYSERYLRNPQVSIAVLEFRSQQFTAIGALAAPRVYNTDRRMTLLESIAMAGGLAADAGTQIYVTDRARDPESGELGMRSLIISVEDLMQDPQHFNFFLGEQALINVPRAGSIFVEGAVERPGVYQRTGETTVLKAIAMAGGLKFEASRSNLRVLRRNPASNEWENSVVSLDEIRESPSADLILRDGDIVMIEYGAVRTAWAGSMRILRDIAFLGFRPLN